ncbi:MAG TPA: hypothetical protein EYQ83_01800 [Acidobacteria bacterium]|nr:hypothetical protein [Acidobacteriota bacterium]
MPVHRPGRAPGFAYLGFYTYLVTCCTYARRKYFACQGTASNALSQIRRAAAAWHFAVIAYCLMPDHLHLVVGGMHPDADFRRFVSSFKQRSGFGHAQTTDTRLWQVGYHDRVLRRDESILEAVAYVLDNPVRAGIVQRSEDYPWSGSDCYTMRELLTEVARNRRIGTTRRRW